MAKKKVQRKAVRHAAHRHAPKESYFVVVRSWTLLVMFALMLGLGAVVGTYLNAQSNESSPTVAGVQVEAE